MFLEFNPSGIDKYQEVEGLNIYSLCIREPRIKVGISMQETPDRRFEHRLPMYTGEPRDKVRISAPNVVTFLRWVSFWVVFC